MKKSTFCMELVAMFLLSDLVRALSSEPPMFLILSLGLLGLAIDGFICEWRDS